MIAILIIVGMSAWALAVLVVAALALVALFDSFGDPWTMAMGLVLVLVGVVGCYGWFVVANHLWWPG